MIRPTALALVWLVAWATPGGAASLAPLDERQRQEATEVGARSVADEAFGGEWEVVNEARERLLVLTPFHRVAMAARQAAFRDKPLSEAEIEKIARQSQDRLAFWVDLRGGSEGFARLYAPRLVVGGREIKPQFVQNERTPALQPDGRFLARCLYAFPARDIAPTSRAVLVVRDGGGRQVSRFVVDLGAMR